MKKSFLAIGLIVLLVGCGGSNDYLIKQKFEANPKVAVYHIKSNITGTVNLRTVDGWKVSVPQSYKRVSSAVAEVLSREWDNSNIEVVNEYRPKGYDLIVYVFVSGSYDLRGNKMPYKSKLTFNTTLQIFDKDRKTLTSVFGKFVANVKSSESSADTFKEAMAQYPPESLVDQLVAATKIGVKKYIAELKVAKPKK